MKSFIIAAILLASATAQADEFGTGGFTITLDPISTPKSSEPKMYHPPTGVPWLVAGSLSTLAGTIGSVYAMSLPVAPGPTFEKAMTIDIVSDVVCLAGISFLVVGMVQSYHYDKWIRSHPWVSGLSPTGYRMVF